LARANDPHKLAWGHNPDSLTRTFVSKTALTSFAGDIGLAAVLGVEFGPRLLDQVLQFIGFERPAMRSDAGDEFLERGRSLLLPGGLQQAEVLLALEKQANGSCPLTAATVIGPFALFGREGKERMKRAGQGYVAVSCLASAVLRRRSTPRPSQMLNSYRTLKGIITVSGAMMGSVTGVMISANMNRAK
jgi:hypothetical protein